MTPVGWVVHMECCMVHAEQLSIERMKRISYSPKYLNVIIGCLRGAGAWGRNGKAQDCHYMYMHLENH